jgi:hypothetical protein
MGFMFTAMVELTIHPQGVRYSATMMDADEAGPIGTRTSYSRPRLYSRLAFATLQGEHATGVSGAELKTQLLKLRQTGQRADVSVLAKPEARYRHRTQKRGFVVDAGARVIAGGADGQHQRQQVFLPWMSLAGGRGRGPGAQSVLPFHGAGLHHAVLKPGVKSC